MLQQKIIFWTCDKLDCKRVNYRVVKCTEIIYTDRCDYCYASIHEPITKDCEDEPENK
jgi:hypothetical protein